MRSRHVSEALVMAIVAGWLLIARGAGAQAPGAVEGNGRGTDLQTVAPQRGRSIEEQRDPGKGPSPSEPVFLEPAATTTEHARLGLSSWIAPGAPFEARENPGGVAIGFTIAWPPPSRDVPSSGPSAWRGSAAR